MKESNIPVILAGGTGSRLWPLSRAGHPKQFLSFFGEHSLFQQAVIRMRDYLKEACAPVIVCNQDHRFLVAEQCRAIDVTPLAIILEPEGRNTAAAIALAAEYVVQRFNNPNLWVTPADHVIKTSKAFAQDFELALEAVAKEKLVTFGAPISSPETAYGYLKVDKSQSQASCFAVSSFVEKPEKEKAKIFME